MCAVLRLTGSAAPPSPGGSRSMATRLCAKLPSRPGDDRFEERVVGEVLGLDGHDVDAAAAVDHEAGQLRLPDVGDADREVEQHGVLDGGLQVVRLVAMPDLLREARRRQPLRDAFLDAVHEVGDADALWQGIAREDVAHGAFGRAQFIAQDGADAFVGLVQVGRLEGDGVKVVGAEVRVEEAAQLGAGSLVVCEVLEVVLDIDLEQLDVLEAQVDRAAEGVVPGEEAEPVGEQQDQEDRGHDGEEAAAVGLAGDQLDDAEEGVEQGLDDVLEAAGDHRFLDVAQLGEVEPEDDQRQQDDDHPGGDHRVRDGVATVDDGFGRDRDDRRGRLDQHEAQDDQSQAEQPDEFAAVPLWHSVVPRWAASAAAASPAGLRRSTCGSHRTPP